MTPEQGYQEIQRLLRSGAVQAFGLSDQELGHGLIDLARVARREIEGVGLKDGNRHVPRDSYEGVLLYRIMPEIARRLIEGDGPRLLLLAGERRDADVTNIPPEKLRRYTSACLANSSMDLISEKVRDRFDPDYLNLGTFFATEAIQQDVRSGNILEIALSRVAPALGPQDPIARDLAAWAAQSGHDADLTSWNPSLPAYDPELDRRPEDTEQHVDTLFSV